MSGGPDYTPTTEEIRSWATEWDECGADDEDRKVMEERAAGAREQFDRWYAAEMGAEYERGYAACQAEHDLTDPVHDAEVFQRGREAAADAAVAAFMDEYGGVSSKRMKIVAAARGESEQA